MTQKHNRSKPRNAVVVLGMHRSGTSALAGGLARLGCDLPKTLMEANSFNPKGYYESMKVYRINDQILASGGSCWDDWRQFNRDWINTHTADEFLERSQNVLKDEFGQSRMFLVKDPRICRLMPFWNRLFEVQGIEPIYVHTHRNPIDVAKSLQNREGWPLAYGMLLWLRHVLDAEQGSRGAKRCFTSYDRLLKSWSTVVTSLQTQADFIFPRQSDAVRIEVEEFITAELCNNLNSAENFKADPLASKWVHQIFEILERWANTGEDKADFPTFDAVCLAFDVAAPMLGTMPKDAREGLQHKEGLPASTRKVTALDKSAERYELQAKLYAEQEISQRADMAALKKAVLDLDKKKPQTQSELIQSSSEAEDVGRLNAKNAVNETKESQTIHSTLSDLGDHFLYFKKPEDASCISATYENEEVASVVINSVSSKESEGYVRLLWSCDELRTALVRLGDDDVIEAEFRFPLHGPTELTWVALIQGDPAKGATHLHQIWHHGDKESLDPARSFVAQLGHLDVSKELHICYHFINVRERATIAVPEVRFKVSSGIVIGRATYENFEVTITGVVYDKDHPRMPVSVQLHANGEVIQQTWARAAVQGFEGSYSFKLGFKHSDLLALDDLALVLPASGERLVLELDAPSVQETTQIDTPLPILETHSVVGKVDTFTRERVIGWALCQELPNTPVDLLLSINGKPFSHVRCKNFREDTIAAYGGSGYAGFEFEIPYGTIVTANSEFSISPLIGMNKIRRATHHMGALGHHNIPSDKINERIVQVKPSARRSPKVSMIVLNQNGADLLVDLFESVKIHESRSEIEWIIVDHQSKDNSEEVCKVASEQGYNVKFLGRNGNYSFSDSNNFGVAAATHDYLVFANNDLIFNGPFVQRVTSALKDKSIGLVGASLTDYIPDHIGWDIPQPIQHLGVYFNIQVQGPWIRAYEMRNTPEVEAHVGNVVSTPVTTGAFMGMRRADFKKIGGFDTQFVYGLEDVDLCLKVMFELDKVVVTDNGLQIAHHRGFSRSKEGNTTVRRRNNNNLLNTRWGNQLRYSVKKDILRNSAFWTGVRPVFGFAVVDAGDKTSGDEYFTALELARALQKIHPIHVRFLTKDEWTDLSEIDVLVVMGNNFNLHQVKKASPFLITINWTRQWFDRWAEDETIHSYDIVFASSQRAADFMHERTGLDIDVLPIATNFERFAAGQYDPKLASDYCLIGNKVGTKREIEFYLDPFEVDGDGAIFGHGWEDTELGGISRGPIPYSQMADVYASSKIAIDDANIATKAFGSCNSQVFDSIAGGALLITNGDLGVQELFGDLVPTYSNKEELTDELNYWITNTDARKKRISELQAIVKEKHTYDARAAMVSKKLTEETIKTRVSIKCAAPYCEQHTWGDTHFANLLAKSLRKQGFTVRVDYRESWNAGIADSDDVAIMLRGIEGYKPKPHQFAIMWLISHPTAVPISEFDDFNQIFVASKPHADVLKKLTDIPVDVLLQCTDTSMFKFNEDIAIGSRPTLFVGNSCGIFRPALRWSIEIETPIDIYGSGWGQFISDDQLKGAYIPNQVLPSYYQTSKNVLCDHSDDIKRLGYLSNRAFDVLAVGGWLTVDDVEGIGDILDGGYSVFHNKEELSALLNTDIEIDLDDRRKRAEWVAEHHSFDARAKTLAATINAGLAERINYDVTACTGKNSHG